MSWQADIITKIAATSSLVSILSDRVFADVASNETQPPYLVYQTITTGGEATHDGDRSLELPTIQFTAWSKTKAQAIDIISRLNAALDGKTLSGQSGITMLWRDQHGQWDEESRLFGEIAEYKAIAKTN